MLNTALVSAMSGLTYEAARGDPDHWGRLVETAVGANLARPSGRHETSYWRERDREVDFVVRVGKRVTAIEVASGRRKDALPGLAAFAKEHRGARPLLVGAQGLPLEEFFLTDPDALSHG